MFDTLVAKVYGTQQDRQAHVQAAYRHQQAAIAECAAGKGITYAYPAAQVDLTKPNDLSAVGNLTAFAPVVVDFGVASRHVRLAAAGDLVNPAYTALPEDQRPAYMATLSGCLQAGKPFEETTQPADSVKVAQLLEAALASVEELPTIAAGKRDYSACLKDAGVVAADWAELYLMVERAFGPDPQAATDITKDPAYLAAQRTELDLAVLDARCRADLRAAAVMAAYPTLVTFAQINAGPLDTLAAEWAQRSP